MTDVNLLAGLGNRIKNLRLKKKMTQMELAMRRQFEKANMSRIESGKTNITIITLCKISKALDVEITELFKDYN